MRNKAQRKVPKLKEKDESETKRKEKFRKRKEAKKLIRIFAWTCERKQNESRFALFRLEAKKYWSETGALYLTVSEKLLILAPWNILHAVCASGFLVSGLMQNTALYVIVAICKDLFAILNM